jgi:uncharacterized protein
VPTVGTPQAMAPKFAAHTIRSLRTFRYMCPYAMILRKTFVTTRRAELFGASVVALHGMRRYYWGALYYGSNGGARVKYALFYQSADDVQVTAPLHFPAHRAHFEAFHAGGTLLMLGVFTNRDEGSMAIFTSREAAEEFARADPFVLNGVVREWRIREWNEVLFEP